MTQRRAGLRVGSLVGFVPWFLLSGGMAAADPPRIVATAPIGVERGVATEVVVSGSNLGGNPRWLGSFGAAAVEVSPAGPADAKEWRVRVTPDPSTPVGTYLVRVQTDGGLSNPIPFEVDQVPHVAEAEDNGGFVSAQRVEAPVVVEGQASGSDLDAFRFAGRRGERVVLDARCARVGSGVDPAIRLLEPGRRVVAEADDSPGLLTDARLVAELPADGDYVVEVSDSRYQAAGPRSHYRLLIGRGLPVAAVFPLGGRRGEAHGFDWLDPATPSAAPARFVWPIDVEPGRARLRIAEGPPVAGDPVSTGGWTALGAADPVPTGGWWSRDVEGLGPLAIGEHPEYREPDDPAAPPLRAAAPAVFNGRIEAPGDADTFMVAVPPGRKVRVAVEAAALGSMLDGVLQVRGKDGAVLGTGDDAPIPARFKPRPAGPVDPNNKKPPIPLVDPEVVAAVPAGTSEVAVTLRDLSGEGGPDYPYRLTVEPVEPGFALAVGPADQVNIPRGGTAAVGVEVERRDFDGPIALDVESPPPGVTVRPGLVPPGQSVGALTVSAAPDARFEATPLRVVGRAAGPAGPLVVAATRTTILAQQPDFATAHVTAVGVPAAPASPAPIVLDGPAAPVEVVPGYPATIPVRATRAPGAEDVVLTFGSLPTTPALTVAADPKLAAKADSGAIAVNTTPDLAPGAWVVAFHGKGKFAGSDRERTIALPAVTLEVVRPAAVELAAARVEVAPGGSAEVRGKLVRRGAFREPVTVKLDGLPAGVKSEPATVAPDAADFVLKVAVDPGTAPAEAAARVALSFQVAKKDYPTPPTPLTVRVLPAP